MQERVLRILHVAASEPPRFRFEREGAGAAAREPAPLPAPDDWAVGIGSDASDLGRELDWYLRCFLGDASQGAPLASVRAERALAALRSWGARGFREAGGSAGSALGTVRIASDDPAIHGWPWEALRDEGGAWLGVSCAVERRAARDDAGPDADDAAAALPADRVSVLLVLPRPEVGPALGSAARTWVEAVEQEGVPAHVHVLRPCRAADLRDHLAAHPNEYHLVCVEGRLDSTRGDARIVLERDGGGADPVEAETIGTLLRLHGVPAAVLSACGGEHDDGREAGPGTFAAAAAALLAAGARGVVVLPRPPSAAGLRLFWPAFLGRLFETGDLAEATRAGRARMLEDPARPCAGGLVPVEDWLLPVSFVRGRPSLSFERSARDRPSRLTLPPEVEHDDGPIGFLGRDAALLSLERTLGESQSGVLLHGPDGIGKTSIARGLVRWLAATGGLGAPPIWISFRDVGTAEHLMSRLGDAWFGPSFGMLGAEARLEPLVRVFRRHRFLLVWDDFERVAAPPDGTRALSDNDLLLLKSFLERLRGGATKVLAVSSDGEHWLGGDLLRRVAATGLRGEERWEYLQEVQRVLGLAGDAAELAELVDGHPLSLHVLVSLLEKQTPREVAAALRARTRGARGAGAAALRASAALALATEAAAHDARELLVGLALHERFVDGRFLGAMAKPLDPRWTRPRIERVLGLLARSGLLRELWQGVYEVHPALTALLRATASELAPQEERDRFSRAFVDVMGRLAEAVAPRRPEEQRDQLLLHGASFHRALGEAARLGMRAHEAALVQGLAAHARDLGNVSEAADLLERLAIVRREAGDAWGEASAYHELGALAQEHDDYAVAESWYLRSLAIKERQGNEQAVAGACQRLAVLAEAKRDYAAAERWYGRTLAIRQKQGEHAAASTYDHLGRVAQARGDFGAAEGWFLRAIAGFESRSDARAVDIVRARLANLRAEQDRSEARS